MQQLDVLVVIDYGDYVFELYEEYTKFVDKAEDFVEIIYGWWPDA